MSYIEKLLDGARVEWRPLEEIFHLKNGYTPSKAVKEFWQNGTIPWFRMEDIRSNGQILEVSIRKISPAAVKGGRLFPANSIIISTTATIGEHALVTIPYLANQQFTNLSLKENYAQKFDVKFLFYYSYLLADWCKKNTNISSFPSVDMEGFRRFKIPIPCPEDHKKSLRIQGEIVRILDTFSALTAELTAELKQRKKQYNYYRDKLLNFPPDEVEWKTLGEVALYFGRGKSKHRPRNDLRLYGGDIPFIQTGDIRNSGHIITQYSQTYSNFGLKQSKIWPKETLCITIAANIAETAILGFDACFPDSVIGFIADPQKTSSHYVEYLLSSFKEELQEKGKGGGAQDNINLATFQDLQFPFPSLAEQTRIVAILDKFETLTNSLTEGLPREIELRQQQYEYYRALLFDFSQKQLYEKSVTD